MESQLDGQKIAFLVAREGVEEVELTEPWKAVGQAGAIPQLLAPEAGEVQAFNHLDKGSKFPVLRCWRTVVVGSRRGLPAGRTPGGV